MAGLAEDILAKGAGDLLTISIDDNLDEILGQLENFAMDQLPYAKAAALFGVGLDAKAAMLAELFEKFTIRSGGKPWAARVMYVHPESASKIKRNIVSGQVPSVTVATRSPLGGMLSDGGVRRRNDGKDFGIPILGGGRKTKGTAIRQGRNAPEDVLRKMKGFLLPALDGDYKVLYVRTAAYKRGTSRADDRANKKAMFIMKKNVRIKPWWNLRDILATAMRVWLPERFVEACEYAMQGRK